MLREITSFTCGNRFLSNFYPCYVELDGAPYPSVEHAYQAAKTFDIGIRERLQSSLLSAGHAKGMGRRLPLRWNWDEIKLEVMEKLLRQKFRCPYFRACLLATQDAELIEGNTWGDTFWGVCNGVGENHLGKLLMQVREEIKNESSR